MSFYELFKKGHQTRNKAHFASIVSLALADGIISDKEQTLLKSLATKLGVNASDVESILKNPEEYPLIPSNSAEERLERIHDLFDMIFTNHHIDNNELVLVKRYVIGLGYNTMDANELVKNSIDIYTGNIKYDEYKYMITKRMNK